MICETHTWPVPSVNIGQERHSAGGGDSTVHIDFYYDIVCPYAYLASTQIEAIAARYDAEVRWHPVLLGGIFRAVGTDQVPMQNMSAPRARHNILDLERWADLFQCPLNFPAEHPRRTVETMRLLVAAPMVQRPRLTDRLYRAYWVDGDDLSDRHVLASIAAEFGIDPEVIDSSVARDGLFQTTQAAVEHGAFGVPAYHVNGQFFWGKIGSISSNRPSADLVRPYR